MRRVLFQVAVLVPLLIAGMNARAIEEVNGVYQIGTPQDLVEFSDLVNAGNATANAVLTADLDMSDISYFPPSGKQCWPMGPLLNYGGIFDGQGHIIYNLNIIKDEAGAETGLFGRLQSATVQNLGIVNATFKNNAALRAGVLAGCANGCNITNCFTAGNFAMTECICSYNARYGDGLLGLIQGSVISNCYTTYQTIGPNEYSTFKGCYWGEDVNRMGPTGELCYKMNGNQANIMWYQTLGLDATPTLDKSHKQVYVIGDIKCDGTILSDNVSPPNSLCTSPTS